LTAIGAIDGEGRITDAGRAIARLALPPRLARMVIDAARAGDARTASEVAVLLTERGLGGDAVDLAARLAAFHRDRSQRADDARRLARGLAARAREGRALIPSPAPAGGRGGRSLLPLAGEGGGRSPPDEGGIGILLASAYPDRIAIAHRASKDARPSTGYGKRGEFLMANGRAAAVEAHDPLAGEPFLAIGEVAGLAASARILLAAPLTLADVEAVAGPSIETADELTFDRTSATLRARRRRRLGALVLSELTLAVPLDDDAARALTEGALSLGLERLPWSKPLKQWRDRVMFLRRAEGEAWPDLSDKELGKDLGWLTPFLVGKTRLDEIGAADLSQALRARLPPELARRLDEEAPTHFHAPTGTATPIDYQAEGGPAIALKVQELFGLNVHPSLAGGRIPLTLHLLSPANRSIQITRDLPGFWRGSWRAVRADLRGRYPRHFWPEDPASAAPTNRAKPRGT
jgi:ATP-dependent helicase HrpB